MSVGAAPPRQQLIAVSRQRQRPPAGHAAAAPHFTSQAPIFTQKAPDYIIGFVRQYRANAVQQPTAGFQQRPEGVEQPPLQTRKGSDVLIAAQMLDVRMAPNDAGRRTGCVEQNAIESHAVEPLRGPQGVAAANGGAQAEPRKVLLKPRQPIAIAVQRHQLAKLRAQLQQLRGLAAGRRTGIQDPHSGTNAEQRRGQLRSGVLNRDQTLAETGYKADSSRRVDTQGARKVIRQDATPWSAAGCLCPVRLAAGPRRIDPQPHRGLAVAGPQNRPPVTRPGGLQAPDQPLRMRVTALKALVGRVLQSRTFPQIAAQDRVDRANLGRPKQRPGRGNAGAHGGMVRYPRAGKLEQPYGQ